ncbi:uncharacterized protein CDV56_103365 [Aspergillus thermomutatus]|uniref:Endonuclease III homolog n=1 Tax=Aspergillus thermomutatus TaxID=41047 RepID=A0A397GU45_ASPTH|nr:uncharacterized protein CDV56_103365 [Aspergillus thermomutatus]RHZ54137.1 hypothetical protein CDV56_103365 [Aspergillus thermomutatus]
MRTSRPSKETASLLQALSPPTRRQTRSSSRTNVLQRFAFNAGPNDHAETGPTIMGGPSQQSDGDDTSSLSSVDTVDIEDILEPPLKKRKSNPSSPSAQRTTRTPGKTLTKREAVEVESAKPKSRRAPARKIKGEDGSIKMEPPSNWDTIYSMVKKMRENNPTAPVDTMGCAELYWRSSSPRDKRFQTLIALMLSSQTKDTVTAVAMQRLHTELGDGRAPAEDPIIKKEEQEDHDVKSSQPLRDSTLNLENILAVSPVKLNELIRTVGFHNNKTKYIKAAAEILRDQYNSDIPSTAEELMKLPGVGPKMAYLCMSAAWGKDEGIGVDVHVHRITNLWGWHKTKTPEETRMALESWLPRDKWHEINKLLVGLGQTVCLPVGRRCGECDLAGTKLCKSEVRGLLSKKNAGVKLKDEVLKDDHSVSGGAKVKSYTPWPSRRGASFGLPIVMDESLLQRHRKGSLVKPLDPDEESFFALCKSLSTVKPSSEGSDSNSKGADAENDTTSMSASKKAGKSLCQLPENVKIRILEYMGLVRPCLIDITAEAHRAKQAADHTCDLRNVWHTRGNWATRAGRPCDHPRLPTEVLMVSREFREDLGALFWAHNRFSFVLTNVNDWDCFFNAIDWAAEDVRYLHIEMRTWDNRFIKPGTQRNLLRLWSRFCRYAAQDMVNLRYFSLKCRVKDMPVALKIMSAMDPFPTLAHCAFHFSHVPEEDICPVVKRNALRLTGNLGEGRAFRYFDLPKEVQLIVLEFLLVNQWDPYLAPEGRESGIVTFLDRKALRVNEARPLTCCGTCSPLQAGCFCGARQTAYSTTCSCFSSPVKYFLVSRAFYEDARRIFFAMNRFAFVEEDPDLMMGFMNGIPTSSFMMLRHLVFKFPPMHRHPAKPSHKPHEDSAMVSWSVLRRFIREHFELSRLSLTIVDLGTKASSWANAATSRNKYMRKLLEAFQDLRGLREFRVYLADDRSFELVAERLVLGREATKRPLDFTFPFVENEP